MLFRSDLDYFPMRPGWVQGNSDGPLVPMVRLVRMDSDAIPMVLLVQNKFTFTPSKNTLIIIMNVPHSIRKPRKTSSLLHQVKARYNSYEYSSFYKPTMQNKFAFTPSKNTLIIIMNIPRSIRQPRKASSLLHQVKTRQ